MENIDRTYLIGQYKGITYAKNEVTDKIDYRGRLPSLVIQNAINSVQQDDESSNIVILDGTYKDNSEIVITSPTLKIHGGRKTIFDGMGIFINSTDHVTISNINFTGNPSFAAIYIKNSNDIKIINCRCDNLGTAYGEAFKINVPNNTIMKNIIFKDCIIQDCGRHGYYVEGIHSNNMLKDSMFINCQALRCGNENSWPWITGFDISESPDLENVKFIDCTARENWQSGFHAESIASLKSVYFIRCISENNGKKPNAEFGHGFVLHDNVYLINCFSKNNSGGDSLSTGCGLNLIGGNNIMIIGCHFEGNTGSSIRLESTTNGIISDNMIVGGRNNIIIHSDSSKININNNICMNSLNSAIEVEGTELIINGNMIDNNSSNSSGIYLSINSRGSHLTCNRIKNCNDGIYITGRDNNVLNNIIRNNVRYSIFCLTDSENNFISMNDVDIINDIGTNNKIRLNRGWMTENDALSDNFPIDSKGMRTVTIPHGLDIVPKLQECSIAVIQDSSIDDWRYDLLEIVGVDKNNLVAKINILQQSMTTGATARLSLNVK